MKQLSRTQKLKLVRRGIPDLATLKAEPLNVPFTLKLWPSISKYLEKNGGPDFIREAILEKLQRTLDQPSPAQCNQCRYLKKNKPPEEHFCKKLLAYLYPKTLNQKFSCDYFRPEKKGVK